MDKVMTLKEAVSRFVKSGDTLFLSGMQHGEPSAAVHEIVRQKIDRLKVISALITTVSLLTGEGLTDKVYTGWMMQDVKRSYALSKAKAMGRLPYIEEYSHFALNLALLAGQMGVPFVPTKCQAGSDFLKEISILILKLSKAPSRGKKWWRSRRWCRISAFFTARGRMRTATLKRGSLGMDVEGINASRKVIVTTEKIVDSDVIRRDPNRTLVPGFRVSAVVARGGPIRCTWLDIRRRPVRILR